MSSSLSVYLVDVTATRALIGSGDEELLAAIRGNWANDLARDDDYHRDAIEQGAPTASEAVGAVVHGGPFHENPEHAFQYAYAYERLCSFTGVFLPNDCFTPHRGAWLSVVDQALEARGVTAVSVEDFGYGSLPAPLPYNSTLSCGVWTPDDIARALEQFESAAHPADESDTAAAVTQCLGWIRRAAARPGFGVIGFRY